MILLTLWMACTPQPKDSGEPASDGDGDGISAPEDCDDGAAAVHPGADEACNGLDDDCDGATDEDPATGVSVYTDGDGDGYGDDASLHTTCESAGAVTVGGDCDDTDSTRHPGAAESCDGADEDCDGVADNGAPTSTWYADADADGHGDASTGVGACDAPPGYVATADDCDDTNGAVHPGATDTLDDGIDQDCTGGDATCLGDTFTDTVTGETGSASVHELSCALTDASPDATWRWTAPSPGIWRFEVTADFDAVLGLTDPTCGGAERACLDASGGSGTLAVWANAGEAFGVVVDGVAGAHGAYSLTVVPPNTTMGTLSAGVSRTCVLEADGSASCAGTSPSASATGPFRWIQEGAGNTCAIRVDGATECWGSNTYGESTPPDVPLASLTAGGTFAMCGSDEAGYPHCWGENAFGELRVPDTVALELFSLGYTVSLGLDAEGAATGWGDNSYGERTPPGGRFVQVSAGHWSACGILDDLTLDCWGSNTFRIESAPSGQYVQVSMGHYHACAIALDGHVECWGDDQDGQASPPGGTFAEVSAGYAHTCGRQTDGEIVCWGANYYGESDF